MMCPLSYGPPAYARVAHEKLAAASAAPPASNDFVATMALLIL